MKSESLHWSTFCLLSPQLTESLYLYPQLLPSPLWPNPAFDIPFSHKEKDAGPDNCLLLLAQTKSYTVFTLSISLLLFSLSTSTSTSYHLSALERAIVTQSVNRLIQRGLSPSASALLIAEANLRTFKTVDFLLCAYLLKK